MLKRNIFGFCIIWLKPCHGHDRIKDLDLLLSVEKPESPEAPNATFWEVDLRLALLPKLHPWAIAALPSLASFDSYQTMVANIADQKMTPLPSQEYRDITKPRVPLSLRCGAFNTGGGDRVIYQDDKNVFGVADGVGASPIHPGPFAAAILKNFVEEADLAARGTEEHRPNDLHQLLRWARHAVRMAGRNYLHHVFPDGSSSTAILGRLDAHNNLGVVSIGDSVVQIFRRDGSSRFRRSPVLTASGKIHARSRAPVQAMTGEFHEIASGDPEVFGFPVRRGDLIIAATDGMSDNLYIGEIEAIVNRAVSPLESVYYAFQEVDLGRKGEKLPWDIPTFPDANEVLKYMTPPSDVALHVATAARIQQGHCKASGPWDVAAWQEGFFRRPGCGKPDDTGVVACWVE